MEEFLYLTGSLLVAATLLAYLRTWQREARRQRKFKEALAATSHRWKDPSANTVPWGADEIHPR